MNRRQRRAAGRQVAKSMGLKGRKKANVAGSFARDLAKPENKAELAKVTPDGKIEMKRRDSGLFIPT